MVATLVGMASHAKTAWDGKANVADVTAIKAQLDDIQLRVRQIQCGKRIDEGCR